MSKIDIKAMIKDLKKNELTELISVAQEVLSTLFNSSEIRENVKESRFSKGYECPKCQCKDVNKNDFFPKYHVLFGKYVVAIDYNNEIYIGDFVK